VTLLLQLHLVLWLWTFTEMNNSNIRSKRRPFRKKQTFNSSYYRKQKIDENTKHYQIKRWVGSILKTYYYKVEYEFTDPELLAPFQEDNTEGVHKPYRLDILAYNEFRGEILTVEINGPYHYKYKQMIKDKFRLEIINEWVKKFAQKIKWEASKVIHKHIALSRNDIYKGFLDYEGVIALMRL